MTEQLAGALLSDNVNGPSKEVEKAAQPATPPLAADLGSGSLIVDGPAPAAAPKPRTKPPADCPAAGESKKLSPLEKADLRAGGSAPGC